MTSQQYIPTLAEMDSTGQTIALAYYEAGYRDGDSAGYGRARREDKANWAWMREHIRAIANTPKYADLARRRGQPERATRAEASLKRRGVA